MGRAIVRELGRNGPAGSCVFGDAEGMRYSLCVAEQSTLANERSRAGLCADCEHARRIESARGSAFYLCELAASDPSYAKYPSLPVIHCAGYEQKIESR